MIHSKINNLCKQSKITPIEELDSKFLQNLSIPLKEKENLRAGLFVDLDFPPCA